jgi:two-component system, response regulator RegA
VRFHIVSRSAALRRKLMTVLRGAGFIVDEERRASLAGRVVLAVAEDEPAAVAPTPPSDVFVTLEEARWQHIARALEATGGNISGAARLLGIHRQSLQRILRGRQRPDPVAHLD